MAPGSIVVRGGSTDIPVPEGSKIVCNDQGECNDFEPCKVGYYGDTNRLDCLGCPAGYTSFTGSLTCHPCTLGKFSSSEKSDCKKCDAGMYQPQETVGSKACQACPVGFVQDGIGQASCRDEGWVKKEDCKDSSFLDDSEDDGSKWSCQPCPSVRFLTCIFW